MKANHKSAAIVALVLSFSAPALANMAPPEPLPPAPAADPAAAPPADPAAATGPAPTAAPTAAEASPPATPPETAAEAPPADPAAEKKPAGMKPIFWIAIFAALFAAGVAITVSQRSK